LRSRATIRSSRNREPRIPALGKPPTDHTVTTEVSVTLTQTRLPGFHQTTGFERAGRAKLDRGDGQY
jgi:hypothetical protein